MVCNCLDTSSLINLSTVAGTDEEEDKADVTINIKELDDVLIKDVGNHIALSGK